MAKATNVIPFPQQEEEPLFKAVKLSFPFKNNKEWGDLHLPKVRFAIALLNHDEAILRQKFAKLANEGLEGDVPDFVAWLAETADHFETAAELIRIVCGRVRAVTEP